MTPVLSVIIPAYNRAKELRRALESLAMQTCNTFEVIVCDDGSSEDLLSVVSAFEQRLDIRYFRITNSGGPARPRNVGIKNARCEWISFLDSDDWWKAERIATVLPLLTDEIDLLYHPLIVTSDERKMKGKNKSELVGNEIKGDALVYMACYGNPIPNSSVITRRSILEKIGGICEDPSIVLEDFDTWLSMAEIGCRFKFLNKSLGYYWVGNDNISTFSYRQVEGQIALFSKHLPRLSPELRKTAESCHYYLVGSYFLRLGSYIQAKEKLKDAKHLPTINLRSKRYIKYFAAWIKNYLQRTL